MGRLGSLLGKYTERHGTIEPRANCIDVRMAQRRNSANATFEEKMMRYMLLWVLGVPIPVLILIWLLWGH
jgi:hypothetical protein